jgi:nucleoid DNA-binding protein
MSGFGNRRAASPARRLSFNGRRLSNNQEAEMPLTQTQLVDEIASRAESSRADIKRVLAALEEVVLEQIANAEKVKIGGVVQLDVRVRPATKARPGRNPATGEAITIAAKPAAVTVKARPLAKAKAAAPSVQKARRRLAA